MRPLSLICTHDDVADAETRRMLADFLLMMGSSPAMVGAAPRDRLHVSIERAEPTPRQFVQRLPPYFIMAVREKGVRTHPFGRKHLGYTTAVMAEQARLTAAGRWS